MQSPVPDEPPVTVARSTGPYGEVVLRRRGHGDAAVDELIVNGAFAMDSSETSSERRLASLAYDLGPAGGRLLVGGLGLGYTAHEALHLPLARIEVVEREPALVQWARSGLTPILARVAADPRVRLVVADVAEVLTASPPAAWDAIALDVDNGTDFLIHETNASLYSPDLLRTAYVRLAPGGRLAIWCQGPAPALMLTLAALDGSARQHLFHVGRGERRFAYAICTVDRPLP
jgi:spermidine synthase